MPDLSFILSITRLPVPFARKSKSALVTAVLTTLPCTEISSTANPCIVNPVLSIVPWLIPKILIGKVLFVGWAIILVSLLSEYTPLKVVVLLLLNASNKLSVVLSLMPLSSNCLSAVVPVGSLIAFVDEIIALLTAEISIALVSVLILLALVVFIALIVSTNRIIRIINRIIR